MRAFLILGSIIFPGLMFFLQTKWKWTRTLFNIIAILTLLIFANISSLSIYQIIKDNTVLMTNIHAVFLNPFFLMTGAYLMVYTLYLLLILTLEK